jgi:hypothetical protein
MNHFIHTLRQLYTVKVDWNGSKYLGMTIDINRKERHVHSPYQATSPSSFAESDRKESRARQRRQYTLPPITNPLKPKEKQSMIPPWKPPHNSATWNNFCGMCHHTSIMASADSTPLPCSFRYNPTRHTCAEPERGPS